MGFVRFVAAQHVKTGAPEGNGALDRSDVHRAAQLLIEAFGVESRLINVHHTIVASNIELGRHGAAFVFEQMNFQQPRDGHSFGSFDQKRSERFIGKTTRLSERLPATLVRIDKRFHRGGKFFYFRDDPQLPSAAVAQRFFHAARLSSGRF